MVQSSSVISKLDKSIYKDESKTGSKRLPRSESKKFEKRLSYMLECEPEVGTLHCCFKQKKVKVPNIKSTFLEGQLIKQDVFLKPPKEAVTKLLKLKEMIYRLSDTTKQW